MAVSTITVLVIDNTRARVSTLRLLSAAGYSTVEAQRGSEALKLLEDRVAATGSSGVDAILKNHDPPESNAVRFLHRLREHPALRAIPTIIVSNLDSREVVLKCLSSGAADYWVRPLRPNEVRVLWTRVWRPQAPVQVLGGDDSGSGNSSDAAANLAEETEPTSKEGSAPDHGSSGDRGKQDTNAAAGSGSGVDDQEAGLTNGIGNGSSRNMGKMDSNTGGAGGSGGDNRNGSGDNGGNGTSAIGQFVPGHSNRVQCDASTAAQAALGMPALPPSQQLSHHHHHRSHSHHRSHHHHPPAVPSAAATEAGSEAPAAWQRLLAAQDAVAAATATVAAAPPLATRPAQAHAPRAQRAALDVFPSPAARPRLLPEQQAAAAGAAAAGMPCTASQVSGDGQYNGGNTGNGSNGATTNGNGGNGNGHGGVTSKQHTAASPLPLQLQIQQALRCSMPASPGSVLPLLPVAAAAGPHPKPWPSPSLAAACWPSSRQQRRQRQLLLQQIKEEEQEEERQRGAAEVADVCEALASLRDSGSPLNSCGMPGGAATGSVPAPAGPGGSTASGKAGRLTRATVAAAAALARAHAAQSVPDSMTAASTDTRHFQQQQQQAVPASTPSQPLSLAAPPALFPPPLPQLFMQQQQAAAVVSRQSPAQSPRHPAAVFAPQQQQQQQQMLPPPFPAGLMPAFGGMPPFLGPHVGFAWGGMPALPSPQQQQYMQQPAQMQAKASAGATSPTASQQGAGAAAGQQAGSQAAVDGTVDAAGQQMHSLLEQQQRAMLAQQHGQQQAQYAWMLQQYSMAAVAAAATGQLPPPPPPPPPLADAFGNLMGWARPPLPWQQQLPPGLSFPTPSFMAPPTLQPPGPATSSLLPPPSTAGSAHPPATLPPLPLPAPLEMLSEEQLTKKETRLLAYARYMEKRKRLHFGKKIRYQTRKALADQRPRVRGQFVRMAKEEAASTGDNKVSASDGGASTMSGSPSPDSQLPAAQEDTATGGPVMAAVALAAVTAGGDGCSPAIVTPACPSPISTAGQQRDEAMEGQEEDQEYDHQEEDLGADEEDLPQPMALAIQPRPRRQHAILRQDESESATMSFGSTAAHHRQGFVSLHPHQQQQGTKLAVAMTAAAASAMALCAGSQPAGTSTTGSPGAEHKGADTVGWQQQLHHHLTGHKHRREPLATAADTSAGGGRNGSDSGSNTPGDHTPMPDSPHGARGHLDAAQLAPPSKQPRMRK